jgi:hypothetical protein
MYVESSSNLNIQKSCFVNNYVEGYAPIWIRAKSGLIASKDNYAQGELISPCQYMFNHETFKCIPPECNVCLAPACKVSYKVYNARNQKALVTLTNATTITAPPCAINIEAIVPCLANNSTSVRMELLKGKTLVIGRDEVTPFFLFGNNGANVLPGLILAGTYTIRVLIDGIVQPDPITFTTKGSCVA